MRISRRWRRTFFSLAFPASCAVVTAYYGYNLFQGPRGYGALDDARITIDLRRQQLAAAVDATKHLQHRIALLSDGNADPDLIEELARTELMDGAQGQIAVPRDRH